jgi:drug/metabolite transporter (DMT)-like permease
MDKTYNGFLNGFIGVAIFSASLPATRAAVVSFDPFFLTGARASIAGCAAIILLVFYNEKRPLKAHLFSLALTALGVVVGFPLLTALALQHITSAHSVIFIGLLPLSTAFFGVLRGGERPRLGFWIFSIIGSALVIGYSTRNGLDSSIEGDLLMLAAILTCGFGYAEGAILSRVLGGWQVISWSLVLSLPFMLILSAVTSPASFSGISLLAWGGLAYVSLFSMLIGFIFWYRGLVQGGIAVVGQLQLLQPFMGLMISAWLLNEQIEATMIVICAGVIGCVALAKRLGH